MGQVVMCVTHVYPMPPGDAPGMRAGERPGGIDGSAWGLLADAEHVAAIERRHEEAGIASLEPADALLLAYHHRLSARREEALRIYRHLASSDDPSSSVRGLIELVFLEMESSTSASAVVHELIARAEARAGNDSMLRGLVLHARGYLEGKEGFVDSAISTLELARSLLADAGTDLDLARVLDSLAMLYDIRGESERSLSLFVLSLAKKASHGDLRGLAITLGNLGRHYLRRQEPQRALEYLEEDLKITLRIGDARGRAIILANMGKALSDTGRTEDAVRLHGEALEAARSAGWRDVEAMVLKELGRISARIHGAASGLRLVDEGLGLLRGAFPYLEGLLLLARGEILIQKGDLAEAERTYETARRIFSGYGGRQEEVLALEGLAEAARQRGDTDTCILLLEKGKAVLGTEHTLLANKLEEGIERLRPDRLSDIVPRSIGPYTVVRRLGGGGFADVYQVIDSRRGAACKYLALKVLRPQGRSARDDDRRRRFFREHQALSRLEHPNIVHVIEAAATGSNSPYIVEEFVEGGDLRTRMAFMGCLPWRKTAGILLGILRGLSHAHAHGIIHRDLKPANILLRAGDVPVIADFGVAAVFDMETLTRDRAILGTLAYMAPEQLKAEDVDPRSDLYSLGVIAYEMLEGSLPREGCSPEDFRESMEMSPLPPLVPEEPEVPRDLIALIESCLAMDIEARPPSAAILLEALGACLARAEEPALAADGGMD